MAGVEDSDTDDETVSPDPRRRGVTTSTVTATVIDTTVPVPALPPPGMGLLAVAAGRRRDPGTPPQLAARWGATPDIRAVPVSGVKVALAEERRLHCAPGASGYPWTAESGRVDRGERWPWSISHCLRVVYRHGLGTYVRFRTQFAARQYGMNPDCLGVSGLGTDPTPPGGHDGGQVRTADKRSTRPALVVMDHSVP